MAATDSSSVGLSGALSCAAARPGNTIVLPGQSPDGQYILGVLLKRTYRVLTNGRCERAETDRKLISGDKHYDGPMTSSVECESDFVPFKLATDVVLNGKVYAPEGTATMELIATLEVGEHRKDIYVIGDRECRFRQGASPVFTDPQPFTEMDVRYERAYGGVDIYSDRAMPCMYARNHLGRGFAIANKKEVVDRLPLPNIEDVHDRITPERLCIGHFMHWEAQPVPQGFGWYAKHWQPRALLAGVLPADRKFEEEMRTAYRELIPNEQRELYDQTRLRDMDFRFFNGASTGLTVPFLKGDEIVQARHLSPNGDVGFRLPGERPRIGLDVGSGLKELPAVLQTVFIRMEDEEIDVVWRGATPYAGPDWLPQMRKLEVLVQ